MKERPIAISFCSPFGQPLDLRPDFLEAFRADQLFKLAAIAGIRVQFL